MTHFIKQTPHIPYDSGEEDFSWNNHIYHFRLGSSNPFLYTSAAQIMGTVTLKNSSLRLWPRQQIALKDTSLPTLNCLTFWRRNYLILAHTAYKMWIIQEPNVRIMKQTAFWREKNGEYIPCLKYSVPIFVE